MSIQLVATVLGRRVGDRRPASAQLRKLILIGFAEHANDDGSGCWPSVPRLAAYAEVSTRQVQRVIRTFEDDGILVRTAPERPGGAGRPGRPREYRIDLESLLRLPRGLSSEAGSPSGGGERPPTGDVTHPVNSPPLVEGDTMSPSDELTATHVSPSTPAEGDTHVTRTVPTDTSIDPVVTSASARTRSDGQPRGWQARGQLRPHYPPLGEHTEPSGGRLTRDELRRRRDEALAAGRTERQPDVDGDRPPDHRGGSTPGSDPNDPPDAAPPKGTS